MHDRRITATYLSRQLGAIVAAMVISAVLGLATGTASQRALVSKTVETSVLSGVYLEIAHLSLNLRAILDADDPQRAATRRADIRRNAERLAALIEDYDAVDFDPAMRDDMAALVQHARTQLERLLKVARFLAEDGAPFGLAARRPVSVGIETGRQVLPEINALRRAQDAALQRTTRRFQLLNSGSFVMSLLLVTAAIVLIFVPMKRHVLDAQDEIIAERKLAEAASKAKSDFLAVMSHEIRTPLNGILGMADSLLASDLPRQHKTSVGIIAASGTALMEVINDVLDLSKIESGRLSISNAAFDLGALLDSICALFHGVARQKGITLTLHRPPGPITIISDERALRQSVINLVGNALKFTHAGGVTVTLDVEPEDADALALRIAVRDTGIGIAPEAQARVFESFEQAEASTTRHYGGTGLGLTISRRLVTAIGGSLVLDSIPGLGSTFTIHLRAAAPAIAPVTVATAPDHGDCDPLAAFGPQLHGPQFRILVVDDSAVNVTVLKTLLRRLGLRASHVSTGEHAVALCRAQPFDMVFMDISMPGMDGYQATRAIRADEAAENRPATRIVGLSAHASDADRRRALAAGMDDYLTKPIRLDGLRKAICPAEPALIA